MNYQSVLKLKVSVIFSLALLRELVSQADGRLLCWMCTLQIVL